MFRLAKRFPKFFCRTVKLSNKSCLYVSRSFNLRRRTNIHFFENRVKNYDNSFQQEKSNDKAAKKVTWIGIWSDAFLCAFKAVAGFLSGSSVLVADALHSVSDLTSGVLSLGALELARKPPDKKHPYGYGHYETLGTLGISGVLFFGSGSSVFYALSHVYTYYGIEGSNDSVLQLDHYPLALLCCVFSILLKESLFWTTRKEAEVQKSPVLLANAWHHRSDTLTSLAALFGITCSWMGYKMFDPLLGIAVGTMVLKVSYDFGYAAIAGLTDRQRSADDYIVATIKEIGSNINFETKGEVRDVHSIKTRRIGNYLLLDICVVVNPKLSVTAGFHAASKVRQRILSKFPEIKDVSTRIKGHPHSRKPAHREKSMMDVEGKPIAFEGRVSDLHTRSQNDIEIDIDRAIKNIKSKGIEGIDGISHCSVHFKVSSTDYTTGRRELVQKVEVNLIMNDSLLISEARMAALAVKEEILKIQDIHAVDIHVELLEI